MVGQSAIMKMICLGTIQAHSIAILIIIIIEGTVKLHSRTDMTIIITIIIIVIIIVSAHSTHTWSSRKS